MLQNDFNGDPGLQSLITRIRTIDQEAANWILENVYTFEERPCSYLSGLFTWRNTPQGQDYWADLDRRL